MPRPEEIARKKIDAQLEEAGWLVQSMSDFDPTAGLGVAVEYFPLETGEADYLLFLGGKAAGAVEAKPEGHTLGGVDFQSDKYSIGFPDEYAAISRPLPFIYEANSVETYFRDLRDPNPRSREVFRFHRPEHLQRLGQQSDTLRARLRQLPMLKQGSLWDCQFEAIQGLEQSLGEDRPRALIQMATGSGKTFTAVNACHRLIKFAAADRILFLVDRTNLGRQTYKEFQQFALPNDGRKFTDVYNVQHLQTNSIDSVSRVCISTIQRLYSMLRGDAEFDIENEEHSSFDHDESGPAREVVYNEAIPVEAFDFIIVDECHRSIYTVWRQVLDYFDASIIGLTATPSKQTVGFFKNNLVMEYGHDRAVADSVNVGYDVYRIRTQITEQGSNVNAGMYLDFRDKKTRAKRLEQLVDDLLYGTGELDRDVVAEDQIRTVIGAFRAGLPEMFPGRTEVPKTLVFAKDDSHAEDIVKAIREEFAQGNDFCRKITYRSTGDTPENLISQFRNSYEPRIAVTVDMISTGTDIKPLECLLFMRNVRSQGYFEQMKGRGTRTISPDDLRRVTPDARAKTRFLIVDAVGVVEADKGDSRPTERNPTRPLDKLLLDVALGKRDTNTLTTLAGRLDRLDKGMDQNQKQQVIEVTGGVSLRDIVIKFFDAIDPDKHEALAREKFGVAEGVELTEEQVQQAAEEIADQACGQVAAARLRNLLLYIKQANEQAIDDVSLDVVLEAGFSQEAKEKAESRITSFKQYIEDHKDELIALEILYEKPYAKRKLTFRQIKELDDALSREALDTEKLWQAYELAEPDKVKGKSPEKILTNLVSLVRHAIGYEEWLSPYPEIVDDRFADWLNEQEASGREFSAEQLLWLGMIKDQLAVSLRVEPSDLNIIPFRQRGGIIKAQELFGEELQPMLQELNERLAA